MKSLLSLKDVRIGDFVGFRFMNKTRQEPPEDIDTWVCVAKVLRFFEEEDISSSLKYKTGEIYRINKKVQFQIETLNPTSKMHTYLGIRNSNTKKFECCVSYNKNSWELCLIECEKDKIEIIKNIMADCLEVEAHDGMYLDYVPYFMSAPWLDYS